MATISLRTNGLDKIQTGFNKFVPTIEPICREQTFAAMVRASKVSPGYLGGNSYTTPPLANSGYERTGALGRSVEFEQDGLSSRLSVNAYSPSGESYTVPVLGDANGMGQGDLFFRRWPTLRSAVDAEIEKLTQPGQGIEAALDKQIKDAGIGPLA